MARDYRYGHKIKKPAVRRTQEREVASESAEAESVKKPIVQQTSAWFAGKGKSKKQDKPAAQEHRQDKGTKSASVSEDAAGEAAQAKPSTRRETGRERSAEMQRIVDEALRLSQPKTIRQEAEKREAKARQEAEQLVTDQAAAQQLAQEKTKVHVNWGVWGGVTLLVLAGIAWLLYAPFFLAFAFEMKWIDEATRNRLDSSAAIRAQMLSALPRNDQQSESTQSKVVPVNAQTPPSAVNEPVVNYSFYRDLPKENMNTDAQPLPVRTRAPVYLQLETVSNNTEAQAERKRLAQRGYLVQLSSQVMKGNTVYVLRMGPYEDQRVVNRLKVELQRLGIDAHEASIVSVIKAAEQRLEKPVATTTSSPSRGEVQQHPR
jgi:hypothetical protein